MADLRPSLRAATKDDIPALLELLLTSFRRFPLFDYLYRPLHDDLNNARDTLYVWEGRLRKILWDTSARIVVAETEEIELGRTPSEVTTDSVDKDSWSMFHWLHQNFKDDLKTGNRRTILGFAIWRYENIRRKAQSKSVQEKFQELILDIRLWFFRRFHERTGIDPERYLAYLKAEEELEARHHIGHFLYLDNLCVDFRVQRAGIGKALLHWGINEANDMRVPIKTETTYDNLRFYTSAGFQVLGDWELEGFRQSTGSSLHLLQWTPDGHG